MSSNTCKVSRWQILKSKLNNLSPDEFRKEVENASNAMVIDVRTRKEFEGGHLFNAVNIDYLAPGFWDEMEKLDPECTYYIYCRSGRRSIRACTLMKNGGFCDIYNLEGGLKVWQEAFGTL